MNMTPMEADAYAQGQTAARCGWSDQDNPFANEAQAEAWNDGFRKWLGVTTPVTNARALGDEVELLLELPS